MAMKGTNIVGKWNASFYDSSIKRWIHGVLRLLSNGLLFNQTHKNKKTAETDAEPLVRLELPFDNVSEIKRSSSSLIFQAITVTVFPSLSNNDKNKGKGHQHWFSSFSNRDETLLFLEYFFNNFVSSKVSKKMLQEEVVAHSSSMGKELLKGVVDSNQTLAAAGSQLVEQGDQLRNASIEMMELNNDLSVASRLTRGLASWLPRWRIPKKHTKEDFLVMDKNDIVDLCSVEALYYDDPRHGNGSAQKCVVMCEKEGLLVFNHFQKIIQHFKWTDVSRVQVINFWQFSISQFYIGKPDRTCNIVSVNLYRILEEVKKYCPNKTEYIDSEVEYGLLTHTPQTEKLTIAGFKFNDASRNQPQSLPFENDNAGGFESLQRHSQSFGLPTDCEVSELSKELTDLKHLAQEINTVQDKQLMDIDELTAAVTQGSDKLSKLNKKIDRI